MAQSFVVGANATSYKVGSTCVHTYVYKCTCMYMYIITLNYVLVPWSISDNFHQLSPLSW